MGSLMFTPSPAPTLGSNNRGLYCFKSVPLSVCTSVRTS